MVQLQAFILGISISTSHVNQEEYLMLAKQSRGVVNKCLFYHIWANQPETNASNKYSRNQQLVERTKQNKNNFHQRPLSRHVKNITSIINCNPVQVHQHIFPLTFQTEEMGTWLQRDHHSENLHGLLSLTLEETNRSLLKMAQLVDLLSQKMVMSQSFSFCD